MRRYFKLYILISEIPASIFWTKKLAAKKNYRLQFEDIVTTSIEIGNCRFCLENGLLFIPLCKKKDCQESNGINYEDFGISDVLFFWACLEIDIQNFECVSDHFSYDSLVVVIQSEYIYLYYIKRIKKASPKVYTWFHVV